LKSFSLQIGQNNVGLNFDLMQQIKSRNMGEKILIANGGKFSGTINCDIFVIVMVNDYILEKLIIDVDKILNIKTSCFFKDFK